MKDKEFENIINQCFEKFGKEKTWELVNDEEAKEKVKETIGNYLKAKLEE